MILTYDAENGNEEWAVLDKRVTARSPETAIESIYSEIRTFDRAVAVPSSAWHVFERTAAFKKVDR